MSDDWKQRHANDSEKALAHSIIKRVEAEYADNMQCNYGVDLTKGLPAYGLHKVMQYVAQVARAQALGFDPELLRLSDGEATAAQLDLARAIVKAGKPVIVVTDESTMMKGT